ncbi:DUF3343 domain-containing protein [uncultured Megasphaera sp.]|uniref:DUF3343 domain-containing protein n=1 Tax=uncultured Megasphaera sp. TaxID=165188 RepID=UPI00265CA73F|nr:DUF3343 domain-containing protein [uncultured Megasphaera sp.]
METYGIALFYNTKDAMQAEAEARRRQIKARIVPTPGKIYASCGFSLRYDLKEEGALTALLAQCGLSCESLYHAARDGLKVSYEKQEGGA